MRFLSHSLSLFSPGVRNVLERAHASATPCAALFCSLTSACSYACVCIYARRSRVPPARAFRVIIVARARRIHVHALRFAGVRRTTARIYIRRKGYVCKIDVLLEEFADHHLMKIQ